jgi:hypothetical protein
VSERIDEARCLEVLDDSTYDIATVIFDVMGFGKPLDETPMLLMPGVLSLVWGSSGARWCGNWQPAWTSNSTKSPRASCV